METATDIKLKLMTWENRSFQHALMESATSQEEALRRLTEMVAENHEWSQRQFAELNDKVDAIIKHLDVPYKPPAGFLKE